MTGLKKVLDLGTVACCIAQARPPAQPLTRVVRMSRERECTPLLRY